MNIVRIYELFPTEPDCIAHLEKVKWHGKPTCPYCQSQSTTPVPKEQRHHCNNCNTTFSVTIQTIFHHTHLPLQKWFLAVSLILNAKKGLSARQLSRDLQVNKDTAWRISMKIREAMSQYQQRELLTGIVEIDEAYIGGKRRKGCPSDTKHKRGRGTDKTPVEGMAERNGNVKAKVVKRGDLNSKKLSALVRACLDIKSATLMTDEYAGYVHLKRFAEHHIINHKVWYVDGNIHTNRIESFWAILKRGIAGQFHKVSLKHLPKYIDEFCYRYNNRKASGGVLFDATIQKGLGLWP